MPDSWPYCNAESHIAVDEFNPAMRCTECREWCHPTADGYGLCPCCKSFPPSS